MNRLGFCDFFWKIGRKIVCQFRSMFWWAVGLVILVRASGALCVLILTVGFCIFRLVYFLQFVDDFEVFFWVKKIVLALIFAARAFIRLSDGREVDNRQGVLFLKLLFNHQTVIRTVGYIRMHVRRGSILLTNTEIHWRSLID